MNNTRQLKQMEVKMRKFIHLSDLHIGFIEELDFSSDRPDLPTPKKSGKIENMHTQMIVKNIIKNYKETKDKPVILITGDITDNGSEEEYKEAVKLLMPLKKEGFILKIVPGNHDYGPMGNIYTDESQELFKKYILKKLLELKIPANLKGLRGMYPLIDEIDNVVYIALDSVIDKDDKFLHFASGQMGREQLNILAEELDKYIKTDKVRVAYFHHHPVERRSFLAMDDAKEVMGILSNVVDFVCFGHKHKEEELDGEKYGIERVLASGKSTEICGAGNIFKPNKNILSYKEIEIIDRDNFAIKKISIPSQG